VHRLELGVRGEYRFPLFGWKGLAAADHLANVISLPPNGRAAVAKAVQHVFVDGTVFQCALNELRLAAIMQVHPGVRDVHARLLGHCLMPERSFEYDFSGALEVRFRLVGHKLAPFLIEPQNVLSFLERSILFLPR
jgi:hypothetical protein